MTPQLMTPQAAGPIINHFYGEPGFDVTSAEVKGASHGVAGKTFGKRESR